MDNGVFVGMEEMFKFFFVFIIGARVICHLRLVFRLSVSFCFMYGGELSVTCCVLRGGVAIPAACWIPSVRVATVSSMSVLDFSGIFVSIRSSRISRKASQSVYLLYSDGLCCFLVICVCMVTITGVWSVESSKHKSISNFCMLTPFVMQKSRRSGCLFVSLGQNVG